MPNQQFTVFIPTTLLSGIAAAATSFQVATGEGETFPDCLGDGYFYGCFIGPSGSVKEFFKCEARADDVFSSVTRGVDGTTAQEWAAGTRVELRLGPSSMDDLRKATEHSTESGNTGLDATDVESALAELNFREFGAHEQSMPDMTVRLEAGGLLVGGSYTAVAAQSTSAISAPSTNPRIDRIVIDEETGAVSIVAGTEAASPSAPAVPSGKIPVAQVALTVGMAGIFNTDITDERPGFVLPGSHTHTLDEVTDAGTVSSSAKVYAHENLGGF